MADPRNIFIRDFNYDLPAEKIALHPLPQRDGSRLLIYKDEQVSEDVYRNIANYLPSETMLVFNNTKVINARIKFRKSSGSIIEIFCLEPDDSDNDNNLHKKGFAKWKCFVGAAAKWKEGELTKEFGLHRSELTARLSGKLDDAYLIEFSWFPSSLGFAQVLEQAGDIPLPPYIKRNVDANDLERYQTIYAMHEGSVAAPTAGLHFTEGIFNELGKKKIEKTYITLHVGAGTFKPVKAPVLGEHEMHAEWVEVSIETIRRILSKKDDIIAVGTTSVRTIETIYWLGVKSYLDPGIEKLELKQWDIFEPPLDGIDVQIETALNALINWIEKRGHSGIFTQTQLMITPGYNFKIIKAIITNFHQPQSTLLLLVAAATNNKWRSIYDYALKNDFRFLSYGDGSLIFI